VNIETAVTSHRDRVIVQVMGGAKQFSFQGKRFTLYRQLFQNSEEPYFQSLSIPTTWVVVDESVDL
jgi:hypothetical protein